MMTKMTNAAWAAAMWLAMSAGTAQATDREACAREAVCASDPKTIVQALQAAGYKAVLSKSKSGNPMVESAASGYNFNVFFYGCEAGIMCSSIQFNVSFNDDGENNAELANAWNKEKRFSQMSFDPEDKSLSVSYDVTTFGGINQRNFADVIDWWATMTGQLPGFFKDQSAKK